MDLAKIDVNKSKVKLAISFVVTLGLLAGVYLVQKTQDRRSKAGPGNATLSVVPPSQTNSIGDSGTLSVFLNPNNEAVAGVLLVMNYDASVLDVTSISPGQFFTDDAGTVGQPVEIAKRICNNPSPCNFGSITLNSGQLYYAIGFPLGSQHSSTAAKNAAIINYTTKGPGTSNFDFVETGLTATAISDTNAQNVYGNSTNGTISVSAATGARLYFSSPTPANPQWQGTDFDVDVLVDTSSQDVDGVDAKIQFDPLYLQVTNVQQGTEPAFTSYPALDFDNTAGTISVSTNTGSGGTATPANGNALNIGTITFSPTTGTPSTLISYDFTLGDRNDSNIVLSGTAQTGDPQDILTSVTDAYIQIDYALPAATATPTNTPTNAPTPTPSTSPPTCSITGPTQLGSGTSGTYTVTASDPDNNLLRTELWSSPQSQESWTNLYTGASGGSATFTCPNQTQSYYVVCNAYDTTNLNCTGNPFGLTAGWSDCGGTDSVAVTCASSTPTSTPQPALTATPTPSPQTLNLRLRFQGRTRTGASNAKTVTVNVKTASGGTLPPVSLTTDSSGEAPFLISPGDYTILVNAPGYLAKKYGTLSNPVTITQNQTLLDLSASPLIGGDFNSDDVVNSIDYTTKFLPLFQSADAVVDLDGSQEVNNLDFGVMRSSWSQVSDTL